MSYAKKQGERPDNLELLIDIIDTQISRTGIGGLELTADNLHEDPNFAGLMYELTEFVLAVWGVDVVRFQGWGTRVRPGITVGEHDHENQGITAVYYLTGGAPIVLIDEQGRETMIEPRPGQMVTFPGSTRHRIERQTIGIRYSFAMAFWT